MTLAIIGLSIIVLFLCGFIAYLYLFKLNKHEDNKPTLTKEQEEKAKLRDEGFQNIMNYDYEKAIERKNI